MKYVQIGLLIMVVAASVSHAASLSAPTLISTDIIISDPQSINHILTAERGLVAGQISTGTPIASGSVQTTGKETAIALGWASGAPDTPDTNIIPSLENPNNTITVSFYNPDAGQLPSVNNTMNVYVLSGMAKTHWRYGIRATRSQTVAAGTYRLAINAYLYAL
jgi:hypothetical protein